MWKYIIIKAERRETSTMEVKKRATEARRK